MSTVAPVDRIINSIHQSISEQIVSYFIFSIVFFFFYFHLLNLLHSLCFVLSYFLFFCLLLSTVVLACVFGGSVLLPFYLDFEYENLADLIFDMTYLRYDLNFSNFN